MDHHNQQQQQQRQPVLTTAFWEDENTSCYELNVNGIVVSRRCGKHHHSTRFDKKINVNLYGISQTMT